MRNILMPMLALFAMHVAAKDVEGQARDASGLQSGAATEKAHSYTLDAKRMLTFKDWRPEDIQSIEAPTLLLIGDADSVRPEHAVEMFRLLPHAQLAVLPGGHGASIGEASAARIEGSQVRFGVADSSSKKQSKLLELVVAMIEEFLDAPMPERKPGNP